MDGAASLPLVGRVSGKVLERQEAGPLLGAEKGRQAAALVEDDHLPLYRSGPDRLEAETGRIGQDRSRLGLR
jgi:hypothetical protein